MSPLAKYRIRSTPGAIYLFVLEEKQTSWWGWTRWVPICRADDVTDLEARLKSITSTAGYFDEHGVKLTPNGWRVP